jgi:hypothetical protein
MASAVFALCALTSMACAVLLLRAYRAERASLLLWTCLCFVGLATNNILLFVDVTLGLDLTAERKLPALAGIVLLLHGFITNSR